MWTEAIGRMQKRMEDTRRRVGRAYPHWADPETGAWTTTDDGDWTGGFWAGMHWLAAKHTGEEKYRAQAAALAQGLKNRIAVDTVFKSFPLYFGVALGAILYDDRSAKELSLAGARSLAAMYNPALKLVPLGSQAEEGGHVGNIETSIDSLQAAPFLFWAARTAGDEKMREVAHAHAATIIQLHRRADDSFIQSSTLDATGRLVKHYTHKGYSATSTWGRAQAWGILFSVMSYLSAPDEASWLEAAERGADWWIAHVPKDRVAFWDFDDPAIPDAERDTAATAVAASRLAQACQGGEGQGGAGEIPSGGRGHDHGARHSLPDPNVARRQARSRHPHRKLLQQAPRRTAARRGEQVRIHRRRLLSARMSAGAGGGA